MIRAAAAIVVPFVLFGLGACGGDDDAADDGTASAGSSGESSPWCDVVEELRQLGEVPESSDPATLEQTYEQADDILERAEEAAPDEIAAAVRTNREGFEAVRDALEAAGWEIARVDPATLQSQLADVEVANEQITEYTNEECGTGG